MNEREIVLTALELADATKRERYLDDACVGNAPMRERIEQMLQYSDAVDSFMESPALVLGAVLNAPDLTAPSTGTLASRGEELETGVLGDFRIEREIGRGGMGVVYEAEQISLGRRVALKTLPLAGILDKIQLTRFKNESRASASLDHPNVVSVYAVGSDRGVHYYAMQFIEGPTVGDLIQQQRKYLGLNQEHDIKLTRQPTGSTAPAITPGSRGGAGGGAPRTQSMAAADGGVRDSRHNSQEPFSHSARESRPEAVDTRRAHVADTTPDSSDDKAWIRRMVELCIQATEALEHAHHLGIVHRDIKPSNLLVDADGHLVIADFGLALVEAEGNLTNTGNMMGTLRYMSPEQMRGDRRVLDHHTDIYSLGVTLYEMLALQSVFPDATSRQLLRLVPDDEPLALRKVRPIIPRDLETIVGKAMAKDPGDRYATARDMADDLLRFLDDKPIHAKPPSTIERVRKWTRRNRAIVTTAAVTLGIALVTASGLLWNERSATFAALEREASQRELAVEQTRIAEEQGRQIRIKEREALSQRDIALSNQYYAEIVSGQADWQQGNTSRLDRKLVGHLPIVGQRDLRGWEWYYLLSLCRPERRSFYFSSPIATWSPDGTYIAASGGVWRADSGEMVRRLVPSFTRRYGGDWSPDGQQFAWGTTADDSCIYIWDRQTDNVSELRGHENSVRCVAWSPNGRQLASGGIDNTVRIWDVAAGSIINTLPVGTFVTDVSWSPNGQLLAAGIKSGRVKIWNPATGKLVADRHSLGAKEEHWLSLSWHLGGEQLAVSTRQSWLLLGGPDWTVTRQQDNELGRGQDIAWRPDGQRIAVADGEVVSIWEPAGHEPVQTLRGHRHTVNTVAWSPDGQQLVTSEGSGEIKVWDLNSPLQPPAISAGGSVRSIAWLPDSKTLVVTDASDGSNAYWSVVDGRHLKTASAIDDGPALWSPDRRLVACRSDSGAGPELRILNATSGAVHSVWRGDATDSIRQLAWSKDAKKLAIGKTSGGKASVELWDVDHEKLISRWIHNGWAPHRDESEMAWSADGTSVAVAAGGEFGDNGTPLYQGHVYLVDVAHGTTILKHNLGGWHHSGIVTSLAWKLDGKVLVAGSSAGLVEAVSVNSGQTLFSTRLHNTRVNSLAWSPDGRRIVSAAKDGSIKVSASDGGEDLLVFALKDSVRHVAWSPNGVRLVAATDHGAVHVWDASRAYEFSAGGRRQGELAWAYYGGPKQQMNEVLQARLRRVLDLAPDTLGFWEMRGSASAYLGDFEVAVQEFAKATEPGLPRSFYAAILYGNALLGAGETDAFRRHCASLARDFADTEVPSNGGHVAWLCALTENSQVDLKTVLRLARANVDANGIDGGDRATLELAAVMYRMGRYEEATDRLTEIVARLERSANPATRGDLACAIYFLAMARQQLGHPFQARRYLRDAATLAEDIAIDQRWTARVQMRLLDQQARALILDR